MGRAAAALAGALVASAMPVPAAPSPGSHEVTGIVRSIDEGSGTVAVDADGSELRLRFPPGALAGIAPGDRVTVTLAIREAGGAERRSGAPIGGETSAPPRSEPALPGRGGSPAVPAPGRERPHVPDPAVPPGGPSGDY